MTCCALTALSSSSRVCPRKSAAMTRWMLHVRDIIVKSVESKSIENISYVFVYIVSRILYIIIYTIFET